MHEKIDLHSHTKFSQDGISDINDMVKTALKRDILYYGISEHINFDYIEKISKLLRPININSYFKNARKLQQKYSKKMNLLVGCELGYAEEEEACSKYEALIKCYKPDYIINSVHSVGGIDFSLLGKVLTKKEMYNKYIQLVRKSIDAPYRYDVLGHLGYVVRYVENGSLNELLENNKTEIYDILNAVIDKGKILEVNTSTYGLEQKTIPCEETLKIYYELGGRNILFGSDAHGVEKILDKFDYVTEMLTSIGFNSFIVPCRGIYKKIEF